MRLQTLTAHERVAQTVNYILFFGNKGVWICRVECWPQLILHLILIAVDDNDTLFLVYTLHKTTVHHVPFGVLHGNLSRQFELDYRYCLMHLRNKTHILFGEVGTLLIHTRLINLARVIGILLHCKRSKRNHIYRIAILQGCGVCIAKRQAQHTRNTASVAGSRTHPQHIVVTPCDVKMVIFAKSIHNVMRTRTAVENIAKNMQAVDYKTLYQVAQRSDEVVGTSCTYYSVDDDIEVRLFVLNIVSLMHQLLNDICILLGKALAHL